MNYIRHRLTNYDACIAVIPARLETEAMILALQARFFAAIAQAYPDLAGECERQASLRDYRMQQREQWHRILTKR